MRIHPPSILTQPISQFIDSCIAFHPKSHNLYEKDPFTTLVLRDYHASTNLPARSPTLRTSLPVVQLYEPARSQSNMREHLL